MKNKYGMCQLRITAVDVPCGYFLSYSVVGRSDFLVYSTITITFVIVGDAFTLYIFI